MSSKKDDDRYVKPEDLSVDQAAQTKVTCPLCEGLGMLSPDEYARCKALIAKFKRGAK